MGVGIGLGVGVTSDKTVINISLLVISASLSLTSTNARVILYVPALPNLAFIGVVFVKSPPTGKPSRRSPKTSFCNVMLYITCISG